MKAIETRWKGWRFRSRTEARWAVFLEALDIGFDYEPEGYHLPVGPYLPDFLIRSVPGLPAGAERQRAFLEIKADQPSEAEELKAVELMRSSGLPVMIAIGVPDYRPQVLLYEPAPRPEFDHPLHDRLLSFRTYLLEFGETDDGLLALGRPAMLPEVISSDEKFYPTLKSEKARALYAATRDYDKQFCRVLGLADGRRFGAPGHTSASARIRRAYDAARGARFEFGQTDRRWDA